jgi:hypothetical protein
VNKMNINAPLDKIADERVQRLIKSTNSMARPLSETAPKRLVETTLTTTKEKRKK